MSKTLTTRVQDENTTAVGTTCVQTEVGVSKEAAQDDADKPVYVGPVVRAACGHPTVEYLFGNPKSRKYRFSGNHLLKEGKFLKTLPCAFCGKGILGNLKHRTIRMLERLRDSHRHAVETENFEQDDSTVYQL